jgi:GNAT superfamily N-acetyltransferase
MVKIPTLKFPALYHIGTLDADHRGEQGESQEGHLLSVSVCPAAWRSIARLGGRPLHLIEKNNGIELLDVHAAHANPELRAEIEAWAIEHGYAEHRTLWKAWTYDCEYGDDDPNAWRYTLHASQEKAANEIEDDDATGPNGEAVESEHLFVGTPALAIHVKQHDLSKREAFNFAALVWAEMKHPYLDGAYWNQPYNRHSLSAPRGGIFPAKISEVAIREVDWRTAPAEDELLASHESKPQLGHALTQHVTLSSGTNAVISKRMTYDGFYNEVIDHDMSDDDETTGQRVLKLELSIDGNVVGGATAGYLNMRRGGHLAVLNVCVSDDWRQHGIATALYDAVENHYGDQVLPYPGNEGGAIRKFWVNRLKGEPELLAQFSENIGPVPRSSAPSI